MRPQALWIGGAVLVLEILLGLAPRASRLTWAMENFPVWIGLVALWRTEKNSQSAPSASPSSPCTRSF